MSLRKKQIIDKTLKLSGYEKLNPAQKLTIDKGLLDRKNMVIAAPTASGKTLCAVIAGLDSFLNGHGKMIYLCPLIALAREKYQSFKQRFSKLGIRVALSIGGFDSSDSWLADYDWIIVSNEKMDSLIRHGAKWINEIGLIVCDEIHLIDDSSRGPTLEILLTRLREIVPHAQILALSATIKNAKELAGWLNAVTVISEWRPVKLYEGISYNSKIEFPNRKGYELNDQLPQEASIMNNTLNLKKQVLFFVATRRSAESLAEKLGKITKNQLGRNEIEELNKLSNKAENILELSTKQCRRISDCIKKGVAFHHSGLLHAQRILIEDNFRKGLIKAICCTPSLAYGINLPAFRAVIRDAKRYYRGYGSRYIPVLEYKQFCGRCGRPQFDKWGESILIAKSEDHSNELMERYILGEPEEIVSKLALEPVLRMHTLALIASGFVKTQDSLLDFFSKTFYSYQYGDISHIEMKLQEIIHMLTNFRFIVQKENKILPTRIGKRVSELYIDPLTAHHFIVCLEKAMKLKTSHLSYLQMMSNTIEMRPLISVRNKDFEEINDIIARNEGRFLVKVLEEWDLDYDEFLKSVNTALMFESWTNESIEDEILSKFRVTPGDLRTRLRNADWLLYASHELALLLGYKKILKDIRKLRVRMKYGVRKELIPLVRLEQIGRVRARKLYKHGLKSISDLRKIPLNSLGKIVGPKIAATIKKQLGEKVEEVKEEKQKTLKGSM